MHFCLATFVPRSALQYLSPPLSISSHLARAFRNLWDSSWTIYSAYIAYRIYIAYSAYIPYISYSAYSL